MRKLIVSTAACLIVFSVAFELHIKAQHIRARPAAETTEKPTPEERQKLIDDCVTPDRPKPAIEKAIKSPVLCGKAIWLPKPAYPEEAKAKGISGRVTIEVVADEKGYVIWAKAVEGDPLLQQAALKAACQSLYSPEKISERAIKVAHVISYNFLPK
jgi:TonB family protein